MRITSFAAPSATARAAAAESAFTLSDCPGTSTSGAIDETTGMRPASSCASTAAGSTVDDVADEPEVDLLAVDDGTRDDGR